jgi:hypothetical protein
MTLMENMINKIRNEQLTKTKSERKRGLLQTQAEHDSLLFQVTKSKLSEIILNYESIFHIVKDAEESVLPSRKSRFTCPSSSLGGTSLPPSGHSLLLLF